MTSTRSQQRASNKASKALSSISERSASVSGMSLDGATALPDYDGPVGIYYGFRPFVAELALDQSCLAHIEDDFDKFVANVTPYVANAKFIAVDIYARECSKMDPIHFLLEVRGLASKFSETLLNFSPLLPVRFCSQNS